MGLEEYNNSRRLPDDKRAKIIDALLEGNLQKVIAHNLNVSETVIKKIKHDLPLLFWNR
jgi:DNA-binding NarL/FixJ family response regulator